MNLSAFKAYDIRGRVPEELDESLAFGIGKAVSAFLGARAMVVGRDVRPSSRPLAEALIEGLLESGVDVVDIGVCGTEEVYFATAFGDGRRASFDGGVMVTASHNPPNYNGMKLVREGARPISADTGLKAIAHRIAIQDFGGSRGVSIGQRSAAEIRSRYRDHLLGYLDQKSLRPLKVVVNPGNGGAGRVVDLLEPRLPFEFIKIHHEPDGTFPHGVPNPMIIENRVATAEAVIRNRADFGIAWDGDFDRCFFFDHEGRFIEGYYLVGMLAESILEREPGARIVHDPRLVWNTVEVVRRLGGTPVLSKSGHAFIKQTMRDVDAAYGGEMSAHHYFRNFSYCDSGMIPWLAVAQLISRSGRPLAEWVASAQKRYPCSGEINRKVEDAAAVIARLRSDFESKAIAKDETDGLSLEFQDWRFNVRSSNTEPLLRLNVETRANESLLADRVATLLDLIGGTA